MKQRKRAEGEVNSPVYDVSHNLRFVYVSDLKMHVLQAKDGRLALCDLNDREANTQQSS